LQGEGMMLSQVLKRKSLPFRRDYGLGLNLFSLERSRKTKSGKKRKGLLYLGKW